MTAGRDLDALLPDDPVDAGCDATFDALHRWVDERLAGRDPARSQPGVAAHLRSCPACREDFEGLLDAAGEAIPVE